MRGVVVAPQPPAAEAGATALRAGGNAFDAAVATAFVQCATDPFMCGIGGIGVAQIFEGATGTATILDFYGRIGSRARPDQWAGRVRRTREGRTWVADFANAVGYGAILIPATVAGLAAIHTRGRLPWRDLLQPAITLLRDGFPAPAYLPDYFVATHQYPSGDHFPPFERFIRTTPAFARLWLDQDGVPHRVGDPLANPDYAATLACLADDGPDAFYRGAIAARMVDDFAAHDAPITAADLADCRTIERVPLRLAYRGHVVSTAPPGGVTLLQLLGLLASDDVATLGRDSPDYLHLLALALRVAFGERAKLTGETDDGTLARFLAPTRLAELRERLHAGVVPDREVVADPGTTHLTVADRDGNVVALTHTLSLGSGVVTPGLGFQYNNGMAGFDPLPGRPRSIAPGRARLTPMAPTIVLRDERPVIALGSPGSNAIIGAIGQVLVNLLDFGLDPLAAVSAPRLHGEGGPLLLETRLPAAAVAALAARGWALRPRPFAYDALQGRVQLAVRTADGWVGASDPRRDGGIAAYE